MGGNLAVITIIFSSIAAKKRSSEVTLPDLRSKVYAGHVEQTGEPIEQPQQKKKKIAGMVGFIISIAFIPAGIAGLVYFGYAENFTPWAYFGSWGAILAGGIAACSFTNSAFD